MAVAINIILDIVQIGDGMGGAALGQFQANVPGFGQSQRVHTIPSSQTLRLDDFEPVPGTEGSLTLANINTALTAAVASFAGATGTPIITAALLAQINAWNTGGA